MLISQGLSNFWSNRLLFIVPWLHAYKGARHKRICESGDTAPHILSLGTKWWQVINLAHWPL